MRNAHTWIDNIIKCLFEPDNRRIQGWIDSLCKKHGELTATDMYGFMYAGNYYRPSNLVGAIPAGKRVLHPNLAADMEDLLFSKKSIDGEKQKIKQTLYMLLEPTDGSYQQIRDALPDCVIDCLPEIKHLVRTREPAFTIAGNPRAIRQYEKTLHKMEEYSIARMIF